MHIAEGVLSGPVLAAGAAVAAGGVAVGLRRIDDERVPRVAVLSAALFVASLVHVPIGPSSCHLVLNGLAGLVLGWAAFPAILVALLLQAVLFGFGGLTTLGVNTVTMAAPAVVCGYLFGRGLAGAGPAGTFLRGFGAGAVGIGLATGLWALALGTSGEGFEALIAAGVLAHLGVLVVEGLVTGSVAAFLRRVRPETLDPRLVVGAGA
jgi:cobalt/nickel transport system permease protein